MAEINLEEMMKKELKELRKENRDLISIIKNEIREIKSTIKDLQKSKTVNFDDPYFDLPDEDLAFDIVPHHLTDQYNNENNPDVVVSYNRETYPKKEE